MQEARTSLNVRLRNGVLGLREDQARDRVMRRGLQGLRLVGARAPGEGFPLCLGSRGRVVDPTMPVG